MIPALALVLSLSQAHWAETAFNMGERYGIGYTFSAIVGQESSWCKYPGVRWSRGCTGIKRSTARIFDKGVTRRQLTDDKNRNLRDGLSFLLYCRAHTKSADTAIACFHWGLPKALNATGKQIAADGYVKAVKFREAQLRALPVTGE